MENVDPRLGEVQETLLIPLYARARDSRSRRPVLGDARSAELVERIDYGFTRFGGPSLPGSVLRSAIFDTWVREFLGEHPAGTVVDVGTGLNTRFERVDNGQVRWFDLDLPDAIELRRAFFSDTPRRTMLAASVLDTDWFDTVAQGPGPHLFIIEAVLLYLAEDQVRAALQQIAERFPRGRVAFDTGSTHMVRRQERNGSMKAVTARMTWICDDPARLEQWNLRLLDSRTFATPRPETARTWPPRYRWGMPLLARMLPWAMHSYRLNLFALSTDQGPGPTT